MQLLDFTSSALANRFATCIVHSVLHEVYYIPSFMGRNPGGGGGGASPAIWKVGDIISNNISNF